MAQDTSVNALYNYVLSFLDVDSTDVPLSLATTWMYGGWDDLIGSTVTWPFYEVGENAAGATGSANPGTPYQITTTVGVQNYALPTIATPQATAAVNPHNIVSVQGPHWELLYDETRAVESTFVPAFIVSQEPERYSYWGTTGITLWPIPNMAITLNIRAYRDPIDWIGLGSAGTIDAPNDFFTALSFYTLAQGWAQQTDLQQASFWTQQYQQAKVRLVKKYLKAPMTGNLVLNGGPISRDLPPRLRYPFEGANSVGLFR